VVLDFAASARKAGSHQNGGSTSWSSAGVLESCATNHMAAEDKGFTI